MTKHKTGQPVTKATDWTGKPPIGDFLKDYSVYPNLTAKLDAGSWKFTQEVINEIVLWKVARYAELPAELFKALDGLRSLKPKDHKKGESVMEELLSISGVRLPMASTIMRFANPKVFQIYDRHIYRAIFGKLPKPLSKKPDDCLPIYTEFLDKLHDVCAELKITFSESDRILFEFDKQVNPPLASKDN